MNKVMAIIVLLLGLISGVLFFNAGSILHDSGKALTTLRSVGGETVAEAYYQKMGSYGIAYSLLAYAMGTGIIMISAGFAGVLLSRDEKRSSDLRDPISSPTPPPDQPAPPPPTTHLDVPPPPIDLEGSPSTAPPTMTHTTGLMCPQCRIQVTAARPICPKCGQRVRLSRPA